MPLPSAPPPSAVSRRNFLQVGASLGALTLLPRASSGAAMSASTAVAGNPGLMFDRSELPRIRESLTHPAFADYWQSCLEADLADDRQFLTAEVDLRNRVSDLGRVSNLALRSAFVHAVAPNPQHLALSQLAISTALKFKTWDWILEDDVHVVGVMRGPMVGVQLSCAQDWLGDDLESSLRAAIFARLADEVGPSSYRAVHGELGATPMPRWSMDPDCTGLTRVDVSQWPKILAETNLQIIATSGLITSACLLPDHPDADKWLELGQRSLHDFISQQPPDGSFAEGSAYWGFTYNYFCLCLDLLHRLRGIDQRGIADFPAMSRYFLRSTMPTHESPRDTLSIGDCSNTGSVIALAWIAREFRDSTAQHLLTRPGMSTLEPTLCWGAIWFDPSVSTRPAADMTNDYILEPGLVVSRTGWTDRDNVLCLRSGKPTNHEHADRNSLLFAAYGERLFNDPVKASYHPNHPKWLLRQTEAHTSVLIDGRGHTYHQGEEGTNASQARSLLTDHQITSYGMTATSDATDAYLRAALPVSRVVRTIVYVHPGILVIFDAVDLKTPLSIELRYQVHNDDGKGRVTADAGSFEIHRPLAHLHAEVAPSQPLKVSTGKLNLPDDMGIYPYAAVTSEPSLRHRLLTICSAYPTGFQPAALTWREIDGIWHIKGTDSERETYLRIEEHSPLAPPMVTVTRQPYSPS